MAHNTAIDLHYLHGVWSAEVEMGDQILHLPKYLTHLSRVDSSTLMLWTGPFLVKGCLVSFYFYHILYKFFYLMQAV